MFWHISQRFEAHTFVFHKMIVWLQWYHYQPHNVSQMTPDCQALPLKVMFEYLQLTRWSISIIHNVDDIEVNIKDASWPTEELHCEKYHFYYCTLSRWTWVNPGKRRRYYGCVVSPLYQLCAKKYICAQGDVKCIVSLLMTSPITADML